MVEPIIKNDAVVLGILLVILSLIFKTSSSKHPFWKKFYTYIPALLLCYFIPSILNSLGILSGNTSKLYFVASRFLLPASIALLTISIDLSAIKQLGFKAFIMFISGSIGIIAGGPISILIVNAFFPEIINNLSSTDEVWKGLSTIAGSWIGGGANQVAMKEVFDVDDKIFSAMVAVDVIIANIWLAFLLYGSGINDRIDKWLNADSSSIKELKSKIETYQAQIIRIPDTSDTIKVLATGFGITAVAHIGAESITPILINNAPWLSRFSLTSNFFWLIVLSTTIAIILSFTRLREIEGIGASRIGSVFIYVLVTTIGLKMNMFAIFDNTGLFLIGFLWMFFHAFLIIIVGKLIRSPFFFMAVGSQANVGGAASAPIVASAFHPSLAPVGVLLAVLGYGLGTYGAWLCGIIMQTLSS